MVREYQILQHNNVLVQNLGSNKERHVVKSQMKIAIWNELE